MKPRSSPHPTPRKACLVKVETWSPDGALLCECDFEGEFADRDAAVEAINQHLAQFERSGYDKEKDCWWGQSSSGAQEEVRFRIS